MDHRPKNGQSLDEMSNKKNPKAAKNGRNLARAEKLKRNWLAFVSAFHDTMAALIVTCIFVWGNSYEFAHDKLNRLCEYGTAMFGVVTLGTALFMLLRLLIYARVAREVARDYEE